MKDMGKFAYEAYARATGGKTYDGRDMPKWEDLPDNIQQAWQAVVQAIVNDVLG